MSKHVVPIMLAIFEIVVAAVCAVRQDWQTCLCFAFLAVINISTVMTRG